MESLLRPRFGAIAAAAAAALPPLALFGLGLGSLLAGFRALDLVAQEQMTNRELFGRLCRFHRELGARYKMGLGAYFDVEREGRNRYGRFHVDVSGYRSWGFSQRSASSGCRAV